METRMSSEIRVREDQLSCYFEKARESLTFLFLSLLFFFLKIRELLNFIKN